MTVYKKDLQREQNAHLDTKAKVAELEGVVSGLKEEVARLKQPVKSPPKAPTVPKESYDKIKKELESVSREKVEMVSKSSYNKLQTEKRKMARQISQMVSINDYKDLVRSYEELKAAPEKVVVRHVKVVDLSLVSKEELEKALIDAT